MIIHLIKVEEIVSMIQKGWSVRRRSWPDARLPLDNHSTLSMSDLAATDWIASKEVVHKTNLSFFDAVAAMTDDTLMYRAHWESLTAIAYKGGELRFDYGAHMVGNTITLDSLNANDWVVRG